MTVIERLILKEQLLGRIVDSHNSFAYTLQIPGIGYEVVREVSPGKFHLNKDTYKYISINQGFVVCIPYSKDIEIYIRDKQGKLLKNLKNIRVDSSNHTDGEVIRVVTTYKKLLVNYLGETYDLNKHFKDIRLDAPLEIMKTATNKHIAESVPTGAVYLVAAQIHNSAIMKIYLDQHLKEIEMVV